MQLFMDKGIALEAEILGTSRTSVSGAGTQARLLEGFVGRCAPFFRWKGDIARSAARFRVRADA